MSEAYKTVYIGDTAEIVEKKSRFIANLEHVESEDPQKILGCKT